MAQQVVLSREEYIALQVKEALGSENRWFAGETLGHSPTDEEAMLYYCERGGASNFSECYIPEDAIAG